MIEVESPLKTLLVTNSSLFIILGVKIMIFPVGGIVTSVWAALFITMIGYGTIGRMHFRAQYRRRATRAQQEASPFGIEMQSLVL